MEGLYARRMAEDLAQIERALEGIFPKIPRYQQIQEAMEYSLLAGGKRIRPLLVLESCRLCGGAVEDAVPFACAIEMVHTYSLIHDDLPAMDNDDLRRGRPTSHKIYGEANAILAGDGLLTAAFQVLTTAKLPSERIVEGVSCLAQAAGHLGMIGGQVLDIAGESTLQTLEELTLTQSLKTGALISAACQLGAIAAGGSAEEKSALEVYAMAVGRAFQIRDDMLDIIGTDQELGKPIGSDLEQNKTTFVRLLGLAQCEELVDGLTQTALDAISLFPESDFHRALAENMANRRN